MLIGKEGLNKWLTIIAMSEMESENDREITTATIIRARFCELIAEEVSPKKKSKCFMCGLFSNLENFIQKEMSEIIDELPIDEEIRGALIGEKNEINSILRLVQAYERVDNKEILELSSELKIDDRLLVTFYIKSINWEKKLTRAIAE